MLATLGVSRRLKGVGEWVIERAIETMEQQPRDWREERGQDGWMEAGGGGGGQGAQAGREKEKEERDAWMAYFKPGTAS